MGAVKNPAACRAYAEFAVDGIPLCAQHGHRTLEARNVAGIESGRVTAHDTGRCEYDRVYASWNPGALRQLAESGRAGEWEFTVELRPPGRSDLVPSAVLTVTAESEEAATAGLRIPAGWAVYVNRGRRVSRV